MGHNLFEWQQFILKKYAHLRLNGRTTIVSGIQQRAIQDGNDKVRPGWKANAKVRERERERTQLCAVRVGPNNQIKIGPGRIENSLSFFTRQDLICSVCYFDLYIFVSSVLAFLFCLLCFTCDCDLSLTHFVRLPIFHFLHPPFASSVKYIFTCRRKTNNNNNK